VSAPDAPAAAATVFGPRLALARRYAATLAHDGIIRGLIGPREVDRLWQRHLLNSAVVTDLVPQDARVVDVGSGAGLPGLAMAIRRPDLRLDLVEPLQRRVDFLLETVAGLGLTEAVRVVRGRAEDADVIAAVGGAEWVVARAVAPLDRLVGWCLPLLAAHGRLLAIKGAGAQDELARCAPAIRRYGAQAIGVQQLGEALLDTPTRVVVVTRSAAARAEGRR
jgi:16S rRNA (guanine527-N7)-methyltransferase